MAHITKNLIDVHIIDIRDERESLTKLGDRLQKCCPQFSTGYINWFRNNSISNLNDFLLFSHTFLRMNQEPLNYERRRAISQSRISFHSHLRDLKQGDILVSFFRYDL